MLEKFNAKQLFFGGFAAPIIVGLLIMTGFAVTGGLGANASDGGKHLIGNKNSSVKVVVYSDFQCPFSGKFYPIFKQLVQNYGNKVSFEFKHFPLNFHEYAQKAAEASECAGEQGKFWKFHDMDFENQQGMNNDSIKKWAAAIGLNMNKFNECLDTGRYTSKVQAELSEGQAKGVGGTPTIFINDEKIVGAQPYDNFKAALDKVVK